MLNQELNQSSKSSSLWLSTAASSLAGPLTGTLEAAGKPVLPVPTGESNIPEEPSTSPETECPVQKAYKCKIENRREVAE
jgi:hypothetical protein